MKFATRVSIDLDDLIETMTHEEAESAIKAIDLAMADYEFTELLAKYFIQALANEHTNESEPFDLNALAPTPPIKE